MTNYRLRTAGYHRCLVPLEGGAGAVWQDRLFEAGTLGKRVYKLSASRLATLKVGEVFVYVSRSHWADWQSLAAYTRERRLARRRAYVQSVWPAAKPKRKRRKRV